MLKTSLTCLILLGCGGVTGTGDASRGGRGGDGDSTFVPGDVGGNQAGGGGPMQAGGASAAPGEISGPPGGSRSSGCLKNPPAAQVLTVAGSRTGYTEFFVNQTGATLGEDQSQNAGPRQFFVRLPPNYDKSRAYRVVYVLQGCGQLRAGDRVTYALFDEAMGGSEDAVYVAVSVPDNDANPGCYDNNSGPLSQDWEAFELMHDFVESTYCVDNDRIFVAGYGSGEWIANMWGCYFGGVPSPERKFAPKWALRGHAGVGGRLPPNVPTPCNGPAAGIWFHDVHNLSDPLATEVAALELQLQTNGCTGTYTDGPAEPWAASEDIPFLAGVCRRFTGCPPGINQRYPLVFCTTSGTRGDMPRVAIPAFTRFFDAMDAPP